MSVLISIFKTIWLWVCHFHWILDGIANALILFLMTHLALLGYRQHSYLYHFETWNRTLDLWVGFIVPFVRRLRPRLSMSTYSTHLDLLLSRSGIRREWTVEHFLASQVLYGTFSFVLSYILLRMVLNMPLLTLVLTVLFAILLPYLKLYDVAARRFRSCNRDLPFMMDYLGLALGAGLEFSQALAIVIKNAPSSPLADEFALMQRNMRLGMSRAEAMLEMDRRLNSPPVRFFVQTMIQGMDLGTDVVRTISALSESLQQKRFQIAEEAAGKISVRMMVPMMCCVMPAVMIILLGPMMLAFLKQS